MRHNYVIEVGDADLDALLWAWRQDTAANAATPEFPAWLSGLLWEQANAVRWGVGAHSAWQAIRRKQPKNTRVLTLPEMK